MKNHPLTIEYYELYLLSTCLNHTLTINYIYIYIHTIIDIELTIDISTVNYKAKVGIPGWQPRSRASATSRPPEEQEKTIVGSGFLRMPQVGREKKNDFAARIYHLPLGKAKLDT